MIKSASRPKSTPLLIRAGFLDGGVVIPPQILSDVGPALEGEHVVEIWALASEWVGGNHEGIPHKDKHQEEVFDGLPPGGILLHEIAEIVV